MRRVNELMADAAGPIVIFLLALALLSAVCYVAKMPLPKHVPTREEALAERAYQAEKAMAFYQGQNEVLERAYGPSKPAGEPK